MPRRRADVGARAYRPSEPNPAEITDILPFNGRLGAAFSDLPFDDASAEVLSAPELDDLTDTDNMPVLRLAFPRGGYPDEYSERQSRGKHRSQPAGAVKSRVMIAAMAAGAAAAAAHAATHQSSETVARPTVLAARA